jgi:hypothetical protein
MQQHELKVGDEQVVTIVGEVAAAARKFADRPRCGYLGIELIEQQREVGECRRERFRRRSSNR